MMSAAKFITLTLVISLLINLALRVWVSKDVAQIIGNGTMIAAFSHRIIMAEHVSKNKDR